MPKANKVVSSLSHEKLIAFLEELRAISKKPTGKQICAVLKKHGIKLSVDRALNFRETTYKDFLANLERKRDAVQFVDAATRGGKSATEVGLTVATQEMLERLVANDDVTNEDLTCFVAALAHANKMKTQLADLESKIKNRDTRLEIAQLDVAQKVLDNLKELKVIASDVKINGKERLQRVIKTLFGEKPADFKPITEKGGAE